MLIPTTPPQPRSTRILVDYRGSWGLGDLLCSEPLVRGLAERYGEHAEIRFRGSAGNAADSPHFAGPADDDFDAELIVPVALFSHLPHEQYAELEAMPSLVDHMCSYGGVTPRDRAPRLNLGEAERVFLEQLGLNRLARPIVAICADGSDRYRGWPVERFRAIAEHAQRRGATVIEVGMTEPLGVGIDLVGTLPIRGTAAVLSECGLFVGNNSGLLHYAQAADVPSIATFSVALPERFVHDRKLVIALQRDDLECIDCMTRGFAARHRSGCTHAVDATCMTGLRTSVAIAALDRVFDEYLADCDDARQPGPRGRAFRADVYATQARRLLERGHVDRAARFFDYAADLCRVAETAAVAPLSV